jgi:NADH pyrophosphatase NudC (nudix superfamily)
MKIRICPKCGRKHEATTDPTKCNCGVLIDPSLDEELQVSS